MYTYRICIYVHITALSFFAYELVHTNEHSAQSAVRQSRLRLRESKHYLVETETAEKVRAEEDSAERLSVSWWCKPGLGVAWIKRAVCCAHVHNKTHTHARRNRHQWLQSRQHIWGTFFHMFNLRGGMSAWHVWMCLVYGFWFGFTPSGMGGVRASGCWDTRAAEHTWLLTEFSNRLGAVHLNALVTLGGQGAHFLHFPSGQVCWLHFHCIKANTRSKWYEGF